MKTLPESWYPMCLATEVKPGGSRIIPAFGTDWLVFRGEEGTAGVLRSTCSHGGVDLRTGAVREGRVVCPMHGWRFDPDGQGLPPERNGKCLQIEHLQVEEYLGVLYAFFGKREPFPFPKRIAQDRVLCTRAKRFDFSSPYQMVGMNAFDTQHLWLVHRRKPVEPPVVQTHSTTHISILYRAAVAGDFLRDRLLRWTGLREIEVEVHSYGGSVLVFEHHKVGAYAYLSMMPKGDEKVLVYMAICREKSNRWLDDRLKQALLTVQGSLMRRFAMEDLEVLQHAKFQTANMDPVFDRTPIQWLGHYHDLSRREMIA